VWIGSPASLLITGALVALIGALVDVERMAMAGRAAFLVVYGSINVAHLRLLRETGASRAPVLVALVGCVGVLAVLVRYLYRQEREALIGLVAMLIGSVLIELTVRRLSGGRRRLEQRGEDAGGQAAVSGAGEA
jgi:hypothetical protein